jgi:hypothetical protein
MLAHPLAEEHPLTLADVPLEVLAAFWNDSLYYADKSVRHDDMALLHAWQDEYRRAVSLGAQPGHRIGGTP